LTLHGQWISKAYDKTGGSVKKVWDQYLPKEEKVYAKLLGQRQTHIEGTLAELGDRFEMSSEETTAFLDGINGALDTPLDIASLEENTAINVDFTFESLYKKMVEYRAEHLVALPEWKQIFDEEILGRLYKEQRLSSTVRKSKTPGRNDLCPCGSGKKYKKCCGAGSLSA
jgi:hypothetical protein